MLAIDPDPVETHDPIKLRYYGRVKVEIGSQGHLAFKKFGLGSVNSNQFVSSTGVRVRILDRRIVRYLKLQQRIDLLRPM